MAVCELSAQDYIFVGEYLSHGNASRAYRVARPEYAGKQASTLAWILINTPRIRDEIERCKEAVKKQVMLDVSDVVKDIKLVLESDARELIEYQRCACRYCHGVEHRYQYTPQEFRDAQQRHEQSDAYRVQGILFNPQGGVGYSPKNDAHPDCPECHGDGVMKLAAHDTRNLSPTAAALYNGARPTNNGVEILTRSKDQARKDAAMFLGMNKLDLTMHHNIKAKDLDDDALAAIAAGKG